MTDGQYANAWERRLKVTNRRHLANSRSRWAHDRVSDEDDDSGSGNKGDMKATTDGQFANIPVTVMFYLVRGHRKS